MQDWDCEGSIEWEALRGVVRGVKSGGGGGGGKEGGKEGGEGEVDGDKEGGGKNGGGEMERVRQGNFEGDIEMDGVHGVKGISEDVIKELRAEVSTWPANLKTRQIVIVDGFLLVGKSVLKTLTGLFDIKILLRASYQEAKERRERRNGYVTLEGFWQDPEGYFDDVVWSGYVREHGWLFEEGDVEGVVKEEVVRGEGVRVGGVGWGLERGLRWVWGEIREGLEREKGVGEG